MLGGLLVCSIFLPDKVSPCWYVVRMLQKNGSGDGSCPSQLLDGCCGHGGPWCFVDDRLAGNWDLIVNQVRISLDMIVVF